MLVGLKTSLLLGKIPKVSSTSKGSYIWKVRGKIRFFRKFASCACPWSLAWMASMTPFSHLRAGKYTTICREVYRRWRRNMDLPKPESPSKTICPLMAGIAWVICRDASCRDAKFRVFTPKFRVSTMWDWGK